MSFIAVTGGSGFVGTRLIDRLLADGHQVRALQNHRPIAPRPGLQTVTGSLTDHDSLLRLTAGTDAVVHCGGLIAARTAGDFDRVNRDGTQTLVDAAQSAGVRRFLLISSLAARAPQLSPYASSKAAAEAAIRQSALDWDIVRPPAVYGPGDRQTLILFKSVSRGIALLPAGRSARASLIHVDDLTRAVAGWAGQGTAKRATSDIDDGAPGGYAWPDIIETAGRALGRRPRLVAPPAWLTFGLALGVEAAAWLAGRTPFLTRAKLRELRHPDWVCRSDPRFGAAFGWQPEITLAEGMQQTVAWYRAAGWLRP